MSNKVYNGRGKLLRKPNASRTTDGLTFTQLDALRTAYEDEAGEVYLASSSGRPRSLIERGWFVPAPCGGYRLFRITEAGRMRYKEHLDAQAHAEVPQTSKS